MRHALPSLLGAAAVVVATGMATPLHAAAPCETFADRPWCNRALFPDDRAAALLAELTQDEKFQLMGGDDPTGVFQLGARTPPWSSPLDPTQPPGYAPRSSTCVLSG
jgi:hypothetical protein